jgi:3-hydroxyacyl-[acyl-carrier-protein] dehydratase
MTPRTLDRVLAVDPGQGALALRNVPNTLTLLDSHFPRFPVLPGVLILESLAELGALAAGDGDWRPAGVERAQFRRFVRPGDQMELSVEVVDRADGEVTLSAKVHVGGKLAARVGALRLKEAA